MQNNEQKNPRLIYNIIQFVWTLPDHLYEFKKDSFLIKNYEIVTVLKIIFESK